MAGMIKVIEKLIENRNKALKIVHKYDVAVVALQAICKHDNKCTGHGHNYSMYKCSKCQRTSTY